MSRIVRKPPKRKSLMLYESAKKKGSILYYAMKYSNDPRMIDAKKHMAHKAYGGMI